METADEIRLQLTNLVDLLTAIDARIAIIQETDDVLKLDEAAVDARSFVAVASDIAQRFLGRASGTPEPEPDPGLEGL